MKEKGNAGWQYIADMIGDSDEILQFEQYFSTWQKQAILLTEISYAEDYHYITPLGVFMHIGTLARALQNIFARDWEIYATLMGTELTFSVNKGIKGFHDSYICHFVELDQAYSKQYCDGWKLDNSKSRDFVVKPKEVMSVINTLSCLEIDPELESSVNFGSNDESIKVSRTEEGYKLFRVPNPPQEPLDYEPGGQYDPNLNKREKQCLTSS